MSNNNFYRKKYAMTCIQSLAAELESTANCGEDDDDSVDKVKNIMTLLNEICSTLYFLESKETISPT